MRETTSAKIGVIGGAIAGLSAALAIADAGHQLVIFGRVPPHLSGALQLAPNGFKALKDLGALDALMPSMTRLNAIEIRSARTNSCLSVLDHDSPQRRDYAAIGRGALCDGLHKLARAHKAISFCDEMVTDIICTNETTSLVTDKATHHSFDLIIGADGKDGLARKVIGASDDNANITRQALRASVPAASLPRHFSTPRTQLWLGNGYHLVSYPFFDSIADEMMVNLVLCSPASPKQAPQILRELLAKRPVLAPLCDGKISWYKTPLPPANQLATWRKNGLVLIGDGAHFMPPHLAQGAGQTLEDAATLKAALTGVSDIKQAAAKWALMRQRALSPIIEQAEATGAMMRLSGPFAMLRNAAVELGGHQLVEKWMTKVWNA